MDIYDKVAAALGQMLGRLLRLALAAFFVAIFVLVAIYHFAAAGSLSLTTRFGDLYAQLIMAGIFTAAALLALLGLWFIAQAKSAAPDTPRVKQPRETQLAALIEALMAGYDYARKREPAP
jgi:hypothetical protein